MASLEERKQNFLLEQRRQAAMTQAIPGSTQPGSGPLANILSAGVEGFKEGFGGLPERAAPFVEQNLIKGPAEAINRPLLEGVPAALQTAGKAVSGAVLGLAGAGGQALEEAGIPNAKENVTGFTRQVMQMPVTPEAAALPGVVAGTVRGVIPQRFTPSSALEPGAQTAQQMVREAGGNIPAQKLTSSAGLDFFSNFASSSLIGGGRMREGEAAAQKVGQDIAQQLVSDYMQTASRTDVGTVVQNAIGDAELSFRAAAKGAYNAVDKLTGGALVDLRPAKIEAQRLLDEVSKGVQRPEAFPLIQAVVDKPDFVPFGDAQIIRSDLLAIGRNVTDVIPGKQKTLGGTIAGEVDQSMENAAKELNPEALDAWRKANDIWKKGKDTFNDSAIKAVVNKDPELVYQTIVRNPASIRHVREILKPEQWQAVQSNFLKDMVTNATDANGTINGAKWLKNIIAAKNKEVFKGIVPDKEMAQRIEDVARTVMLTQKGNEASGFKMVTSVGRTGFLPEAYAVYSIGKDGPGFINGAILLGPRTLAAILNSKRLSNYLVDGLGNPSGTLKSDRATKALISALVVQGLVDRTQDPKDNLRQLNSAPLRKPTIPAVPTGP